MRLLANTTSPFARIARVAMIEKRLSVEPTIVNHCADDPRLPAANAATRVPALVTDDGAAIAESRPACCLAPALRSASSTRRCIRGRAAFVVSPCSRPHRTRGYAALERRRRNASKARLRCSLIRSGAASAVIRVPNLVCGVHASSTTSRRPSPIASSHR